MTQVIFRVNCYQNCYPQNGVSVGIWYTGDIDVSETGRWGSGSLAFDVLGQFVMCQWCMGIGRKLWVKILFAWAGS